MSAGPLAVCCYRWLRASWARVGTCGYCGRRPKAEDRLARVLRTRFLDNDGRPIPHRVTVTFVSEAKVQGS